MWRQPLPQRGHRDNVCDRIQRADLVEVDLLHRTPVDGRLRLGQRFEDGIGRGVSEQGPADVPPGPR